jgi:hypothetical protein
MHGFAAEVGRAIPSPTVTGRAGQWRCRRCWYTRGEVVVSPPSAERGPLSRQASLASLARGKSLSGQGEPPTRRESCVQGGVVRARTANTRGEAETAHPVGRRGDRRSRRASRDGLASRRRPLTRPGEGVLAGRAGRVVCGGGEDARSRRGTAVPRCGGRGRCLPLSRRGGAVVSGGTPEAEAMQPPGRPRETPPPALQSCSSEPAAARHVSGMRVLRAARSPRGATCQATHGAPEAPGGVPRDHGRDPTAPAPVGTRGLPAMEPPAPWTTWLSARCAVRAHGAIGAGGRARVVPGSRAPRAGLGSGSHGRASRRSRPGAGWREGVAWPRGGEDHRGTGYGNTGRPGRHGGCRVTGIPTVETTLHHHCPWFPSTSRVGADTARSQSG